MKKATDKQISYLLRLGYKGETANLDSFKAHLLIDEYEMLNARKNVSQTVQNEPKIKTYENKIYYEDAEKLNGGPITPESYKAFCDKYNCEIYF